MVRSRARYAAKVDTLKTNSDVEILAFYILHVFDAREPHSHVGPLGRAVCFAWLLSGRLRPCGSDQRRAYRCVVGEHRK